MNNGFDRLSNVLEIARKQLRKTYNQVEPNFPIIGIFGVLGFPFYYVVWKYFFPQPYENLALRLIGSLVCVPLVFLHRLPEAVRHGFRPIWYVGMTYCLPFFFTYMSIRNNFTVPWQLSLLCTIFLSFFLFDWVSVSLILIAGSGAAWLACYAIGAMPNNPELYLQDLPIFAFLIVAAITFDRKAEMLRQERRRAAEAVRTGIAAEILDPILGIATGATGIRNHLPVLLESYRVARSRNLPVPEIENGLLQALEHVAERVQNEARHLSTLLDLLRPASKELLDERTFETVSMRRCIEAALARYPYRSAEEQRRVTFRRIEDFAFRGLRGPMENVIISLIHDCLASIHQVGGGNLTIWLKPGIKENVVYLRDGSRTTGISPRAERDETSMAEGICSLSICEATLRAFGGAISIVSNPGEPLEYRLKLPADAAALKRAS